MVLIDGIARFSKHCSSYAAGYRIGRRRGIWNMASNFSIIDRGIEFLWGSEERVDSVLVDQLPIMVEANCTSLAFVVEAGIQKIVDR
jgi:hypothetical protein